MWKVRLCTTLQDVANVLKNAIKSVLIELSGSTLVFTSKKVGASSSVVISSGTSGTDISTATYLNITAGTTTNGADSSGETIREFVRRLQGVALQLETLHEEHD